MSTDLIVLIRAAIDEDERIALAATRGPWRWHRYDDGDPVLYGDQDELVISVVGHDDPLLCIEQANMDHTSRFDPKRMLDEVAAKRKVLAAWQANELRIEEHVAKTLSLFSATRDVSAQQHLDRHLHTQHTARLQGIRHALKDTLEAFAEGYGIIGKPVGEDQDVTVR